MRINVNGQQEEAYDLIMKKENAMEILNGAKTIEIRQGSPHFEKMFTDYEQLAKNKQSASEGRDEWQVPIRNDIAFLHFRNYISSWSLDCEIDEIGTVTPTKEDAEFLAQEFGCHEFDDAWQEYEGKPDEEIPYYFYIHIAAIVGHHGLV